MKKRYKLELHYSRTLRRTVIDGHITYACILYTSNELRTLANRTKIHITKFAEHKGEFDIEKLLVHPVAEFKDYFWIRPVVANDWRAKIFYIN